MTPSRPTLAEQPAADAVETARLAAARSGHQHGDDVTDLPIACVVARHHAGQPA